MRVRLGTNGSSVQNHPLWQWWWGCAICCLSWPVLAQAPQSPPANPAGKAPDAPAALVQSQEEIQLRFRRFETSLLNMAQYLRQNEPERAALLERVMGKSNEGRFSQQMEKVIEVLKKDQLGEAIEREEGLVEGLQALLDILNSEDRAKELAEEKARVEAYLKDVQKLLGDQRDVRAGTERGEQSQQLTPRQERVAKKTQELEQRIAKDAEAQKKKQEQSGSTPHKNSPAESKEQKSDSQSAPKPSEQEGKAGGEKNDKSQPEAEQKGLKELEQARKEMQRALDNLKKQQGREASEHQDSAIQELERAKEQLEKILKQLREEEKDRQLARLEERLQQMLIVQTGIYGDTIKIHKIPEKERTGLHRNNAIRLGRQQKEQVLESEKILRLFSEEGSAVAFNEAVQLMRNDQQTVAGRLDQTEVGELTQSIEKDILATLKEMIGALQKEMENRRQQKNQPGTPQQQNSQEQESLVQKIAELKMLQRLQVRINNRTRELEKLTSGDKPPDPALLEQLRKLSQGQARIQQAAYDLAIGRND